MPTGVVKTTADESDWEKAKEMGHAAKPDDFWAFVMSKFQQLKANQGKKRKE